MENKNDRVSFASGKRFVESMRSQGLTDNDAVKEFIDNSLDAESKNVDIWVWEDGGINIMVQDDGVGMSVDLLKRALAFGESDNDIVSNKIGRFGFGMPSAIVAKTRKADVFTKQIDDPGYRHIYLDLDEIATDPELKLPFTDDMEPEYNELMKKDKKRIRKNEMGTIVLLKGCDKLKNRKASTIAQKLKENLGETYRKFIGNGKNIRVNGEYILKVDPLMALKEHYFQDLLVQGAKRAEKEWQNKEQIGEPGFSKQYGDIADIEIEVNREGKKEKGYVRIKLYLLPQLQQFFGYGEKNPTLAGASRKFKVGYESQGFYLMRNHRQIAAGSNLNGVFKRDPHLTQFRGEVDFDPVLDEEFGIQNNKSRFYLTDSMITKIQNSVNLLIIQIRNKQKEISKEITLWKAKDMQSKATEIGDTTSIVKTRTEKEMISKGLDKVEKEIIEKIDGEDISDNEKNKKKEEVRRIFQESHTFEIKTEINKYGPIYTWEYLGKTTVITLNKDHPFFDYYWMGSQGNLRTRTLLELLLFTQVKGEQYHKDETKDGNYITYDELNNYMSQALRRFLNNPRFIEFIESYVDEDQEEKNG